MAKHKLSKWFDKGAGHVTAYRDSDVLLFSWHGKPDGSARYIPHVKRYARDGMEYASLAALLRSVEAEHAKKRALDAA